MRNFFKRTALYIRGRALMQSWLRLVDHFGDGVPAVAEKAYPRLASYRRRAMRIVRKLHAMKYPERAGAAKN